MGMLHRAAEVREPPASLPGWPWVVRGMVNPDPNRLLVTGLISAEASEARLQRPHCSTLDPNSHEDCGTKPAKKRTYCLQGTDDSCNLL